MTTIFTKIINKELNANIVYESKDIIVFKDINPVAPIHFLIIPKKEIPTINDIKDNDKTLIGDMVIQASKIAKKFKVDQTGYRLVFNCNKDAGQSVSHIHMHLIGGRKLGWPPG